MLLYSAAAAQGGSVPGFPPQANVSSFGLSFAQTGRRFSYGDFAEPRRARAGRALRLSLGGSAGEVGDLLSFPFRKPGTTALFVLGTAALISVDRQSTAFYQDKIIPALDGFSLPPLFTSNFFSPDSQYLLAGVGLTYAGGLAFNDERAQTAALLSGKAIAYSYLTSQLILKPLFGRLRPIDDLSGGGGPSGDFTDNPWDFGHRDGIPFTSAAYGTSMPSFHFTHYFAAARVYAGIYDNNFWPYLAAGVLAASEARGHHHWVSDMVAGSVIGIGIGNLVLNRYEERKNGLEGAVVMPVVSSQGVGFSVSMEF